MTRLMCANCAIEIMLCLNCMQELCDNCQFAHDDDECEEARDDTDSDA